MGEDEQATLDTLTAYRSLMSERVVAHAGRVVDSPGDALLAEFPSAVGAVQCAVEIQKELAARNAQLPESRRMLVRIGVNLGDVLEQDSALYGDGVNIAARLQALAEPGGVCVSGTVFDQVEGKIAASLRFAGEQTVKNIAKPVRVYHLATAPSGGARWPGKRRLVVAALVLLMLALGAVAWQTTRPPELPAGKDPLVAMPSGPVIAVLPFTNMSGDATEDYLSDGLTEDIITELARFRELHVLARNTTFQYKGHAVDIPTVGRKLGAQYVLEGSVRKTKDRVRITTQLIDVRSGTHLWAERFDRSYADIFVLQDEVTQKIVATLAGGHGGLVQNAEVRRADRKKPEEMQAYELVLRARVGGTAGGYSHDWYNNGKAMLERAIAIDPNYARAREEYAWLRLIGWIFRFDTSPTPPREVWENATKAVGLDPNDAYAHRTAAYGYYYRRQFDSFGREAIAAMELAPYNAEIYAQLGMLFTFMGEWDRGMALVSKAIALNRVSADGWFHTAAHYYHYNRREYQKSLDVVLVHPALALCETQWKFVASYGQLGQPDKAKEHWEKCEAIVPDMSADWIADVLRIWNFEELFIEHYMQGIRKAGYPCRANPCGQQDYRADRQRPHDDAGR
jgi:adenylate cyclase